MMLKRRWLTLGLILSLISNVFFVGYFLTKTDKDPILAETIHSSVLPEIRGIFKHLPAQQRNEILLSMKRQKLALNENYKEILKTRLQIAQVLQQPNLDKQKLLLLLNKMSQLSNKSIVLSQESIYQILINLPQAERIKIAKILATKPRLRIKSNQILQSV